MSEWKPIATAPCDDRLVWVKYKDGVAVIDDLDHDSSPEWWAARGAVAWREASQAELDIYYKGLFR